MPYTPNTVDQHDRERQYLYIWFGAACSVITFANAFIGSDFFLFAWALGGAVGGLLAGILAHRTDDYFQSLAYTGLRWAAAAIAAYLLVAFMLDILDVAYSAGYALSNPDGEPEKTGYTLFLTDARTLASFAALAFHAGYAFAWAKDRLEEDET